MKKTQMALAAVALVASSAALADVTIYGAVDASVAGGSGIKARMDGTGNWGTSHFGFKGSDDLGNGMKAGFALEAGVSATTGAMANGGLNASTGAADNGRIFNRQANAYVSGDFGTVKLGLQLSPFIAGALGGYANGSNSFVVNSLAMTGLAGGSGTNSSASGGDASNLATGGFFIPNSVSYSISASGVSASVLTQVSNGTAANEYTAATVGTSLGGVNVNASYENRGGTYSSTNNAGTGYNINASTTVGGLKVAGGVTTFDPTGTTAATTAYTVSTAYPVSDALVASLGYASSSGANSKSLANVGLQYNLSKSTFAYAMVGQGKNTGVLYAGGPTSSATSNVTGYAVGISHAF